MTEKSSEPERAGPVGSEGVVLVSLPRPGVVRET